MLSLLKTFVQSSAQRRAELYRNLIRHEAKIGGTVFGAVPSGHRREFFCLDERTWVWHEEWTDQSGQMRTQTTRYDVRQNGILKAQGPHYQPVSSAEAKRLYMAAQQYRSKVKDAMYASVR